MLSMPIPPVSLSRPIIAYSGKKVNFRFFLLPGKAHGDTGLGVRQIYGEGQGVPLLTAIRKWREEGKAPAYLSCAHITEENGESKVKFTRDIYPYLAEKHVEGKEYPPTTCRRYLGEQ